MSDASVRSGQAGIVAPVFDPAESRSFRFGVLNWGLAPTMAANVQWTTDGGAIGNQDSAYWVVMQKFDTEAGEKEITRAVGVLAFFGPRDCYEWWVDVWRDDGSEYTLVASSPSQPPDSVDGSAEIDLDLSATPIQFTQEDGKDHYVGFRCRRKNAVTSTPWFGYTDARNFKNGGLRFSIAASWNGSTVTKGAPGNESNVYASADVPMMAFVYTSTNRLEHKVEGLVSGDDAIIATLNFQSMGGTGTGIMAFYDATVADGGKLVIDQMEMRGSSAFVSLNEIILDLGNTTPGSNTFSTDTLAVPLPDIDGNSQAGKLFNIYQPYDVGDARHELFFQCCELEPHVNSHRSRYGNTSEGQPYGYVTPTMVTITETGGVGSVGTIVSGYQGLIICGDSQTISNVDATSKRALNYRLGGLPDALERIWVMCGESGRQFLDLYAESWKNTTPGYGDLHRFVRWNSLWCFAGMGLNDISIGSTANQVEAKKLVSALRAAFTDMANQITQGGDAGFDEDMLLLGLPPYSASGVADQWEAHAIRSWNREIYGCAIGSQYAYHNPWMDMVAEGTEENPIPTFDDAYTDDAGTHYNANGGAIVVGNAANAYEQGLVDTRDQYDGQPDVPQGDAIHDAKTGFYPVAVASSVVIGNGTVPQELRSIQVENEPRAIVDFTMYATPQSSPVPFDPSDNVSVTIKAPDLTEMTYQYGVNPEVIRSTTGQYYIDFEVIQVGTYYVRWWCDGAEIASNEKSLRVVEVNTTVV